MNRFFSQLIKLGILVAIIWLGAIAYVTWYAPLPINEQQPTVRVPPRSNLQQLAKHLHDRGLVKHPRVMLWMARWHGWEGKLRFGEYQLNSGMSLSELLRNMVRGRGFAKHQITLIEGWTFRQVMEALTADKNIRVTLAGKSPEAIMQLLRSPYKHPEGLFFPDTYIFTWGNTDLDVLRHAYKRMQKYLRKQWEQRAADLPYESPYEALIVASLVEKETAINEERPRVAGVILRRLEKRMRLQIDPTVLYGLHKSYGEPITKADLKSQTAYNTYQNFGLPPTPIDMPGAASIKAALHPSDEPYLYYVSNGDGTHQFSTTYKKHLVAVKRYRQVEKQRKEIANNTLHWQPRHLWRSPLTNFASFILCFMCI